MAPTDKTLIAIYDGWGNYQKLLVKAVAPLTVAQLNIRVAPNLRTIGQLLTHLIAVRVGWYHGDAGAGSPNIAPLIEWDRPDAPTKTPAELVNGLEMSWQLMHDALDKWTSDELSTPFEVREGDQKFMLTRQWIVWHVIEHDLHHGGELSFALGINNLTGIDI